MACSSIKSILTINLILLCASLAVAGVVLLRFAILGAYISSIEMEIRKIDDSIVLNNGKFTEGVRAANLTEWWRMQILGQLLSLLGKSFAPLAILLLILALLAISNIGFLCIHNRRIRTRQSHVDRSLL